MPPVQANVPPELDPIRLVVEAEENLMGFRQNLVLRVFDTAIRAAGSGDTADLEALITLHAGVRAIDFALANKPSAYKLAAPI